MLRRKTALSLVGTLIPRGVVAALLFTTGVAVAAEPLPPGAETAFVFFGEADPSGVDQAFLALGRRRGAPTAREVPGQLGEATPGARLARAVGDSGALRFADAVAQLDALEREVTARGGAGLTQGELVDLYAHRAGARMALGDEGAAWDDLLEVAALAPARPLDPARFAPRLIEAERRAALSLTATGKLAVTATPADALLIVDGQLLGSGHVELERPVGRHLVRVERAGFEAVGQAVVLEAGGAQVTVTLQPAPAPEPTTIARRTTALGAARAVAAFAGLDGAHATVELQLIDARSARLIGRTRLYDDQRITTGDLAAAVDGLVGAADARDERIGGVVAVALPWYRRPLLWGVAAGVVGAAALGLGLGLGLGLDGGGSGFAAHVDLGRAR